MVLRTLQGSNWQCLGNSVGLVILMQSMCSGPCFMSQPLYFNFYSIFKLHVLEDDSLTKIKPLGSRTTCSTKMIIKMRCWKPTEDAFEREDLLEEIRRSFMEWVSAELRFQGWEVVRLKEGQIQKGHEHCTHQIPRCHIV